MRLKCFVIKNIYTLCEYLKLRIKSKNIKLLYFKRLKEKMFLESFRNIKIFIFYGLLQMDEISFVNMKTDFVPISI